MLVLTGQGTTHRLHKESHQVMDVVAMFEPVTKWAETVRAPGTIPEIIRKAVRVATTEKPGAVHIELPEDVAKLEQTRDPLCRDVSRSVPDDKIVDQAFDILREASKPVILSRARLHPATRKQSVAAVLRKDRDWRGQHVHGKGLRRYGCRLLPVHCRTGRA